MRRPAHRWSIVALAWLLVLLAIPAVAGLAGVRSQNLDNRGLAPFPATTPGALLDADHYAAIDRWAADHLPLRDRAITAQSKLDTDVFHDSGPVLIGSSGWLFLTSEVDGGCSPAVTDAGLVDALGRGTAIAEERNVPVAWIIIPDKGTSMPDRVPRDDIGCAVAHHRSLDRAVQAADLPVVFPNAELATGLADPNGPPLWWRGDSHQTPWGHLVEVEAVVDLFEPGLYDPSAERRVETTDDGDLWRLLGQPRSETIRGVVVDRPGTRTTELPAEDAGPGLVVRRYRSTGPDRRLPGQTVIVHDSHFDGSQQLLLAPWFDDITFVPTGAIDTPQARGALVSADRLIVEGVERGRDVLAVEAPVLADRLRQR